MEVELDRDRRLAMWAELQRIYAEELPVLPLYWRANAFVLRIERVVDEPGAALDLVAMYEAS